MSDNLNSIRMARNLANVFPGNQMYAKGACTIANLLPLRTDRISVTPCGTNPGHTKGHLPNFKRGGDEQKGEKS